MGQTSPKKQYVIKKKHQPKDVWQDLYHGLLAMPWPRFLIWVASSYLLANVVFALLYYLRPESVGNMEPDSFSDAFFFSIQTMSTVGYGHMYPATLFGNVVSSIELVVGLISLGVLTGLVFAKFSRPNARVLFSRVALVTTLDEKRKFMFRVANERSNQIVDAHVTVAILRNEETPEGVVMRRFYDVPLIRDKTPLFALSWTVMHDIDEDSPFFGMTDEEFATCEDEIFVTVIGTDGTSSQTIHARHIYDRDSIRFGGYFADVISSGPDNIVKIDYSKFHTIVS